MNRRNIVVAKRNQQVTDLAFKQQVITVVVRVQQLYRDLVSLRSNVDAARRRSSSPASSMTTTSAVSRSARLRRSKSSAPRPKPLRARRPDDRGDAGELQETLLKNAISINGVASPSLIHAEIIPTDRIEVPRGRPFRSKN
ncbi:MAG: hypothetical protein R2724_15440 [Bryobacterales bacterium]